MAAICIFSRPVSAASSSAALRAASAYTWLECCARARAITRHAPAAASSASASFGEGRHRRFPRRTGTRRRASSFFARLRLIALSGERPPMASCRCRTSRTSSGGGAWPRRICVRKAGRSSRSSTVPWARRRTADDMRCLRCYLPTARRGGRARARQPSRGVRARVHSSAPWPRGARASRRAPRRSAPAPRLGAASLAAA
jgi:hypothetical protein